MLISLVEVEYIVDACSIVGQLQCWLPAGTVLPETLQSLLISLSTSVGTNWSVHTRQQAATRLASVKQVYECPPGVRSDSDVMLSFRVCFEAGSAQAAFRNVLLWPAVEIVQVSERPIRFRVQS